MSGSTGNQPGNTPAGTPVSPQPAGSASGRGVPEFGQYAQPEYGQLAVKYPGWDPYIYGRPEAEQSAPAPADGSAGTTPRLAAQPQGNPQSGQVPATQQPGFPASGPQQSGQRQPGNWVFFGMQPINLDDPQQNPYYGRWDSWAILSFILSLFSGFFFPILPLFIAWMALRRTQLLHTRGRGLAIAALVISLLSLVLDVLAIWLGFNPLAGLAQLLGVSTGGSGNSVVSTAYLG